MYIKETEKLRNNSYIKEKISNKDFLLYLYHIFEYSLIMVHRKPAWQWNCFYLTVKTFYIKSKISWECPIQVYSLKNREQPTELFTKQGIVTTQVILSESTSAIHIMRYREIANLKVQLHVLP